MFYKCVNICDRKGNTGRGKNWTDEKTGYYRIKSGKGLYIFKDIFSDFAKGFLH